MSDQNGFERGPNYDWKHEAEHYQEEYKKLQDLCRKIEQSWETETNALKAELARLNPDECTNCLAGTLVPEIDQLKAELERANLIKDDHYDKVFTELLNVENERNELKLLAVSDRAILLKLADSIERYADSGLIDNYTVSEPGSPSLSDVLDEARAALNDGEQK